MVVGVVVEARDQVRIMLKNRYGFVRMALKRGSFFVSVFTFGKNSLYSKEVCCLFGENDFQFKIDREIGKNYFIGSKFFNEAFNYARWQTN